MQRISRARGRPKQPTEVGIFQMKRNGNTLLAIMDIVRGLPYMHLTFAEFKIC